MKTLLGLVIACAALAGLLACYPHDPSPHPCPPNDRSCLPCPNPQTTDPSCAPWILDAKKPDAGADK